MWNDIRLLKGLDADTNECLTVLPAHTFVQSPNLWHSFFIASVSTLIIFFTRTYIFWAVPLNVLDFSGSQLQISIESVLDVDPFNVFPSAYQNRMSNCPALELSQYLVAALQSLSSQN